MPFDNSIVGEPGATPPEAGLIDLVALAGYVWRRRSWLALAAILGLLGSLLVLNFTTPRYAATLRITPAASSTDGSSGAVGRIGSLAALAGVQVRQSDAGATPFELYLERIKSRQLAEKLVADHRIMQTIFESQWNKTTHRFEDHPGPLRGLRDIVYALAGQPIPLWQPPGAARLQEYLTVAVTVAAPGPKDLPITTLRYLDKDPSFAVYLLGAISSQADADIRAQALRRGQEFAAHLGEKLASTVVAEHRVALSEALLEQQRAVMMATSSGPFAALPTEPATASRRPVQPVVLLSLALGLGLGVVVGVIALAVVYLRQNQSAG